MLQSIIVPGENPHLPAEYRERLAARPHADVSDDQARDVDPACGPAWFIATTEARAARLVIVRDTDGVGGSGGGSGDRQEFAVVADLADLGFDAWMPAETKWKRTPRRRDVVKVPLLRGYLFVALTPDAHGDLPFPAVLGVEGVQGFLGVGEPRPIPYGGPTSDFHVADPPPKAKSKRKKGDMEAPREPRSLWEIRAMEAAGVFDYTRNADAAKAAKKAQMVLKSFAELATALAEKTSEKSPD